MGTDLRDGWTPGNQTLIYIDYHAARAAGQFVAQRIMFKIRGLSLVGVALASDGLSYRGAIKIGCRVRSPSGDIQRNSLRIRATASVENFDIKLHRSASRDAWRP